MNLSDVYNDFVENINNMTKEDFQQLADQAYEDSKDSYMLGNPDNLEKIIREAFDAGENWGVCYSGWFSPSEEDKEEQVQKVLAKYV